jgi:tetratricopeptide (TPR) repeat protein
MTTPMRRDWYTVVVLLLLQVPCMLWVATSALAADTAPERLLAQGRSAFQRGDFKQAIVHWRDAVHHAEQAQQLHAQSVALTHLAHAYQALGHYEQARDSLAVALRLAEHVADQQQIATVLGSLGDVYIALGPVDQAAQHLNMALERARAQHNTALEASLLNNLGNLLTAQNAPVAALEAYQASATLAQGVGHLALIARALTNASMAATRSGRYVTAQALLEEALTHVQHLAPAHDIAYIWTKIGLIYNDLQPYLPDVRATLVQRAAAAFKTAAVMAQGLGDHRAA